MSDEEIIDALEKAMPGNEHNNLGRLFSIAKESLRLRRDLSAALEALREVLDTRENEAKLRMRADVAVENYSNPQPEVDAAGMAMVAASEAERRARELLARIALAKGRGG